MNNLPKDFNINSYKLLNNDLKNLNNNELIYHYLTNGINEGRLYKNILPEDFDLKAYKNLNNDLKNLNDTELVYHYLNIGVNEGRLYKNNLPEDFDLKAYKTLNNDLKDLNNTELIYHYLKYGVYEKRIYMISLPDDFNIDNYIDLNDDLIFMNKNDLIKHYILYGKDEFRLYKKLDNSYNIYNKLLLNNNINYINSINYLNINKRKVYSLWIGDYLQELNILCIKSFLYHNYDVIIYTYNIIKNLPYGVKIMDANEIINHKFIYKFMGSFAGFSDLFRWKLLYLFGGIWIDLDLFCIKPLDFDTDIFFSYEDINKTQIESNPIKIFKNSDIMLEMYSYCFNIRLINYIYKDIYDNDDVKLIDIKIIINIIKENNNVKIFNINTNTTGLYNFTEMCKLLNLNYESKEGQNNWIEFGPKLLTNTIKKYNYEDKVFNYNIFNIIEWNKIDKFIKIDSSNLFNDNNIYLFNLFGSMWKKNNQLINIYEKYSLLDKFHTLLNPSINLVLATIGRNSIFRMLESLKFQLQDNDVLTIIYDGNNYIDNIDLVKEYLSKNKNIFNCKLNLLVNNENLGYFGHAIRNKYNDFEEDYIIHIDDDDYMPENIIKHIKNTCVNKNTIYMYQCIWQDEKNIIKMWKDPILKLGNIGTPCGIIPKHINKEGYWELCRGGDYNFYENICNKYNTIFVDKVHYIIRNCVYKDEINDIKISYIENLIENNKLIKNNYNIYLINLKEREDRKNIFIKNNEYLINDLFNIITFNAIKNKYGWIGCSLSHLYLIYYAKKNNLPYIIISEDDTLFINDNNYINNLLLLLFNNLDKWTIFNGNPTYGEPLYNYKDESLLKFNYSNINDTLINISWGQTTNFMIYNKNSYDKMLQYDFINPIDLYISKNFKQITSKKYITKQINSFSDIENKFVDYNNFIDECQEYMLKNINN